MVNQILNNQTVETNNTYNNNKKEVPSYLCDPVFADKDSIQKILIDSGYYKAEDVGL
jgi:putative multiple sugar transport system substrate-binding protein